MSGAIFEVEAVAVGASAGGVEALSVLLAALPAGFRPAIVAVLHLPPDKPSLLAGLLASRCQLPVHEALDKERIEAGTVYLAPPDYHLLVETERVLALSQDPPVAFSRPSVPPEATGLPVTTPRTACLFT